MEYKENVYAHLKMMQDDEVQGNIKEKVLQTVNSLEKSRVLLYTMLQEYIDVAGYVNNVLCEPI